MPLTNVAVPHTDVAGLLEQAQRTVHFTRLDPHIQEWDFVRDARGKIYHAMTWTPSRRVSTAEVRAYFAAVGFRGITAAFVVWVAGSADLEYVHHVSIPETDDELWTDPQTQTLHALGFFRSRGQWSRAQPVTGLLGLPTTQLPWQPCWTFVAFRQI